MPREYEIIWEGKHPNYPGKLTAEDVALEDECVNLRVLSIKGTRVDNGKRHGLVMAEGQSPSVYPNQNPEGDWYKNHGERQIIRLLLEERAKLARACELHEKARAMRAMDDCSNKAAQWEIEAAEFYNEVMNNAE